LLGATSALAYLQSAGDFGSGEVGVRLAGTSLVLRLEQDASFRITDGSDLTALTGSMTRWNDLATTDVAITEGARFNFASPIDASAGIVNNGSNAVYFAETDSEARLGQAIAVSFISVNSGGTIVDCDIVFNESLYTFSTRTPANPDEALGLRTYDLGEIATHEVGHCLGLDHSAVAGRFDPATGRQVSGFTSRDFTEQATLYPFGSGTIQGRSLATDDAAGVSSIYPNATLAGTTGTIAGRVLKGDDNGPIRGAHVVAVTTAAPDIPVVGVLSDLAPGGPGGEYRILGLPPGSYYVRIEPLPGGSNPFTQANTHFQGFDTGFPWEFYDGATESGFDQAADRTPITLAGGQIVSGIDLFTNVASPDPNEPNGTPATATPFGCERSVAASIAPLNDVDYFALPLAGATSLQIDVDAAVDGSPLDAVAGLFDAAGNLLAFADNSPTLDPLLLVDVFSAGTYYVALASHDDRGFSGQGGLTAGNYRVTVHCSIPDVRPGTCPGRVLYAASNEAAGILAVSDADRDLRFDGESILFAGATAPLGGLASRRDGGVCLGGQPGLLGAALRAVWDDDGDFVADRADLIETALVDAQPVASFRRGGEEHLFTGDLFDGGTVVDLVDTDGDGQPERMTTFTTAPESVLALGLDEAGTLYVLDALGSGGLGSVLAYRDSDGDGVADVERTFLSIIPAYGALAARRPGELYAADVLGGRVDRITDGDGDGVADSTTIFADGLALSGQPTGACRSRR
jgi:hypothetical protein